MERPPNLDLGDGHQLWWTQWSPDRELNPQYADQPDVNPYGAIVSHVRPDGERCWSGITFRGEVATRIGPADAMWDVVSLDPLTLSPSLLCRLCGDHGFIRSGRWVRA